jgi:preprotein translocase subunit YajC
MKVGMLVVTISGRFIGNVRAIDPGSVEVQLEDKVIRLLPDAVFNVEGERVWLVCERAGLPKYEVAPPTG